MERKGRLIFIIIILALLLHVLLSLLIFKTSYLKKSRANLEKKEIVIEYQVPEPNENFEPVEMLPGKISTPNLNQEITIDTIKPSESNESLENLSEKEATNLEPEDQAKKNMTELIKSIKSKRTKKPTFNFNMINDYAQSLGHSAFKNQGVQREVNADDIAILVYQEKVRKHFHISWNNYANKTTYYNLTESIINLHIIINKSGQVIRNHSSHDSNNPALLSLLAKVLQYAQPFPPIPDHMKKNDFEFKLAITLAKGKFDSGYNYT